MGFAPQRYIVIMDSFSAHFGLHISGKHCVNTTEYWKVYLVIHVELADFGDPKLH